MNGRFTPGMAADRAVLGSKDMPLVLDPATMEVALAEGTAIPLTSHITSLVTYRGVWWLDDDDAWLQITDQAFATTLETIHGRHG